MRGAFTFLAICAFFTTAAPGSVMFGQPGSNPYQGQTSAAGTARGSGGVLTPNPPSGGGQPSFVVNPDLTTAIGGTNGGLDDPSVPPAMRVVARLDVTINGTITNQNTVRIVVSGTSLFNRPGDYDAAIDSFASLGGILLDVNQPSTFAIAPSGLFSTAAVRLIDDSTSTTVSPGAILAIGRYRLSTVPINFSVSDDVPNPIAPSGTVIITIPSPDCAFFVLIGVAGCRRRRTPEL